MAHDVREMFSVADDLYFIRGADAVKIGRSNNVKWRLTRLQAVNAVALELYAVLEGAGEDEARWHLAFHDRRSHGEWFKWGRGIERAIKAAVAGDDWILTVRQSLRFPVRQSAMTTQMVARLSRRRIVA